MINIHNLPYQGEIRVGKGKILPTPGHSLDAFSQHRPGKVGTGRSQQMMTANFTCSKRKMEAYRKPLSMAANQFLRPVAIIPISEVSLVSCSASAFF